MRKSIRRVESFIMIAIMAFTVIPLAGTNFTASAAAKYMWPVVGNYSVSRWNNSVHYGVDITNSGNVQNPQIISTYSGTVTQVSNVCSCTGKNHAYYDSEGNYIGMVTCLTHKNTYGNLVKVLNDDGTTSVYGHLKYDSICVKVGDRVSQGQVLGLMGDSGVSTGIHLHFEIRTGSSQSSCIDLKNTSFLPANIFVNYTSPPTKAILTIDKTECKIGEVFKISVSSDIACNYYMSIIDIDTNEFIYSNNLNSNYYESSFLKAGHYTAYVTAYNDLGSVDSNWIDFYIYGEKPTYANLTVDKNSGKLGDGFTFTTKTDAYYNKIYISIFNDYDEAVCNGNISQSFSFTPNKEGVFRAYVTAYTNEGGVDSNWVTFSVGIYNISYNANGGSGTPSSQTKTYGTNLVLSSTIPTKENYNFIGWNSKSDGTGVSYQPGDVYTDNADVTLYAMWELAHTHSYTSSIKTQPTCTGKGQRKYTCSCGDEYFEDIVALGHAYKGVVTKATCTNQGFTTYTCSRCGDSFISNYTDALNHLTSTWYTVINPTVASDGLMEKRCDKCNEVIDQLVIPKLIPDYVTGISLSDENETVEIGDSFTLTATVIPDTAKNKKIIWSSRNPEIATVKNGMVTAVKPGTTAIVAESEDGGYVAFCLVRVIGVTAVNGAVINNDDSIIYGFSCNLNSADSYLEPVVEGMSLELSTSVIGTGTLINLVDNGEVVDTYTAIIFGDVNGDGWYDGEDAFLVNLFAKGMLSKDDVGEAIWTAADCNHDGVIDENDVDLLTGAGLLLNNVDQSATQAELAENAFYIEYMGLIDQSVETNTDSKTDDTRLDDTVGNGLDRSENENDIEIILADIITFLKQFFSFILSLIFN